MWVSLVCGGFFVVVYLCAFKFYFGWGFRGFVWEFLWFVFLFVNVSTGFENVAFFRPFADVSVFCSGQNRGL